MEIYGHSLSSTPNLAGVDMVRIFAKDYHLTTLNGWSEKGGHKVGEPRMTFGYDATGQPMKGSGYYLNRGEKTGLLATYNLMPSGLSVTFNPSTIRHPYDLTTGREGLRDAVAQVERECATLGLSFDAEGATLAAIDLTKQAVMKAPFSAYAQAIQMLKGKRMKSTEMPGLFRVGNKSRGARLYDKTRQLAEVKGITDAPKNLLRNEIFLIGNKVVGSTTNGVGLGRLGDLLNVDAGYLTDAYNTIQKKDIFRVKDGVQLSFDWEGELSLLQAFTTKKVRGKAHPLYRYISHRSGSWDDFIHEIGGYELMTDFFQNAGVSRKTAQRWTDIVRAETLIHRHSKQSEHDTAPRIRELIQTFAA
jgi:hypothetical protein